MKRRVPFFYGYVILVAVWSLYFCGFGTITYGASIINAEMQQAMGFQEQYVGLAGTLCTLVSGLTGPIVGRLIAKHGTRRSFLIGTALLLAAALALAFLPQNGFSFLFFYGLIIGTGLGFAGLIPVQSTVNDWFDQKKSFAMSVALTAGSIGGFMAPLILKRLLGRGGWTLGWRYAAAMALCGTLMALVFLVDRPEDLGQSPDGLPPIPKSNAAIASGGAVPNGPAQKRAFRLILFTYASRTALYYPFIAYLIIFLRRKGFSSDYGADTLALISIFSLLGRLLMAVIPERRVPSNITLGLGNVVMGLSTLMICLSNVPFFIRIGAASFGLGLGFVTVALPLTISRAFGQKRFPVVNGRMSLLNYLFAAGAPALVGQTAALLDGYALPIGATAVLATAGGVASFFINLKQKEAQ